MADEPKLDTASVLYPNDTPQAREEARYGASSPSERASAKPADSTALHYPDDQPKDREEARFGENDQADGKDSYAPLHGVPEGGYELTPPEGLEITKNVLHEIAPTFRELGLSSAGAQKLMPHVKSFHERIVQGQIDAHRAAAKEWEQEVRSDPDLGGANWGRTQNYLSIAMRAVGEDSEFERLMNESRIGSHPVFVRAFRNIGRKLAGH